MEAGVRLNLNISHILTLPKRNTQRAVLDFVKSLRPFSRVHATEGEAHMASWDSEEAPFKPINSNARSSQSCGFATPVLKPRVVPPTPMERSTKTVTQTRIMTSPKKPLCHAERYNRARANTSTKPGGTARSKEGLPPRECPSVKRNRELQSDEEKRMPRFRSLPALQADKLTGLQERREKKRTRREIMRPEGKHSDDDSDWSKENLKPKHLMRKLPSGLALMHGFTATNVGKNRLTVRR